MAPLQASTMRSMNQWVARIIPMLLFGAIGYASYVVIKRICLDYYIYPIFPSPKHVAQRSVGIGFLVPFCIMLFLCSITYLRLILVIFFNPGLVPLGPRAVEERSHEHRGHRSRGGAHDLEGQPYLTCPDSNPDSPGLEQFYSKDVFVCEDDGNPRWCSHCMTWKPDRAHHSSEMNRCVRKMDHFCPWVGGIIGETSYKFFVQFVFYAALYCIVALTASAYALAQQIREGDENYTVDHQVIAVIALAGFFGLFTTSMTLATARYIFINQTNVDVLKGRTMVHQLAIRIPRDTPPNPNYRVVTYPLPKQDANGAENGRSSGSTKILSHAPESERDRLATRKFALVRTEMGENPWDLGWYHNWTSIMGITVWEWVLPLHESPCVNAESSESFYQMGPLLPALRRRFGLPDLRQSKRRSEMRQRWR